MEDKKTSNKLLMPISIILGSIIVGGFYYVTTINKQGHNEVLQNNTVVVEEKIPTKIEPKSNTNQQLINNKALQDTRNAQRRSDVLTILNAIYQYSIDNNGNLPGGIITSPNCTSSGTDALSLRTELVGNNSIYLNAVPLDPLSGVANVSSGYYITFDGSSQRVTVCAPSSENVVLSVTR